MVNAGVLLRKKKIKRKMHNKNLDLTSELRNKMCFSDKVTWYFVDFPLGGLVCALLLWTSEARPDFFFVRTENKK